MSRPVKALLRRPVILLVVVLTMLSLGAGSVVVAQVSDEMVREADARLDRHAGSQAQALSALMSTASRDLRLARQNAIFDTALTNAPEQLPAAARGQIEQVISYVATRYQPDEICLIRANGAETARWNGGVLAGASGLSPDETDINPAFKPAMALPNDTVFVTEPYVSPDSGRWVYGFATPIVLATGQSAGILHIEVSLQHLADDLATRPFGGSGYNALIDRQGRLLIHPDLAAFRQAQGMPSDPEAADFPKASSVASHSWRAIATTAAAGGSGEGTFDANGGTERVAYRPVPGTDWSILSVSPTRELYADVERGRLNLLITGGPLVLSIVILSVWFANRMTRANRHLDAAGRASSVLASIVRSADDAIVSVQPDGTIATWNDGAAAMYGIDATAAIGASLGSLSPQDRGDELPNLLKTVLAGNSVEHHETVQVTADGTPLAVSLTFSPIRAVDGELGGVSLIARDISDRKRLEEELAHQALHDSLTDLPNRALFQDRLRESLHRAPDSERPVTGKHAVLFVDLDDFKVINDTLGHRAGDQLLIGVAERIRAVLRTGDTAARLGGDEFTILIENVSGLPAAERAAERLLESLRRPFELDGHQIVITASIGIAVGLAANDDPDELLRSADIALYEAKGLGKGRHAAFRETMQVQAWRRLEVEVELRRAIAGDELRVHYQPIVDLVSGQIREVEALVRWQHPERGLIQPSEFISVAEQTGLIEQLGEYVLGTACRQLAEWDRLDPAIASERLTISVNVAARQLAQPGFDATVARTLARNRLGGDRLKLEITENATVEGETAIRTLRAIRELGVRIAIDDFGTGYSSLGSFRELPIDGIKIDRTFVGGLGREREATAIVSAAIAFAQALGLEVTGEGIETVDQLARLKELGCVLGQGFLFARPLEAVAITELLSAGRSSLLPQPSGRSTAA
ncbi:MAG: EAL domain-containing protein [Chloroflexota bacterium]|nr:EAL domain-containing protein [Chloroflexota bacterium]